MHLVCSCKNTKTFSNVRVFTPTEIDPSINDERMKKDHKEGPSPIIFGWGGVPLEDQNHHDIIFVQYSR